MTMKCEACKRKIEKSYRVVKGIDTIPQCVECYWLICYTNGNHLADMFPGSKKMSQDKMFEKVHEIAQGYPECSSMPNN